MHEYDDQDRKARLADIVEYTKRDMREQRQHDHEIDQQVVHIHYHEAERPAPPPPPPQDLATKYAGHFMLLLGGCIILAIIGVIAAILVPMIMGMLISLAICAGAVAVLALAVAATVKSLGSSNEASKINRETVRDLRDSRRKGRRR